MTKQAVIIYGPPGSGKGTQAELLARKYNFSHFDTGRYIEALVHDPRSQKDPVIKREKKLFDTGILNTPSWVLKITREITKKINKADLGIIYSGSPRTMFESFGDNKSQGLLALLVNLYGKKNIFVIKLDVKDSTSVKRNSARWVCSVCGLPVLGRFTHRECAFCGGPLKRRTLDDPKIIKIRLGEYKQRTYPILAKIRKSGFKVLEVNGEPAPYKVHAEIIRKLRLR